MARNQTWLERAASLKDQTIQLLPQQRAATLETRFDRANRMIGDLYGTWYLGETIDSRRRN